MDSLAGHFLVASPHLTDPSFARTAILMLQHEDEGALGVIVNRVADKTVREVWEMIEADPCDCDEPIYQGGPVPGPLVAVHTSAELAEHEVLPGLFTSMQRDAVDIIVRRSDLQFRLFSGNSGWAGGQLEGELKVGGWLRWPASVEDIFSDPDDLW
ncbi:YqgE/AlgH family protein, partial [Pirellulales bacterium]|nr:YqgE/AlgH family protein [Pirellulales bacterium]